MDMTDDDRWTAVLARDLRADGTFLYGVMTTGVYCRPSCAARPARRENVRFFADVESAQAAGLRACKRCRPDSVRPAAALDAELRALGRWIETHADEPLSLTALAARVGLSPSYFQRRFTAALGASPREVQAAARLARLKASLREGDSVAGAIFEAGFGSTSRVYEQVDGRLGMTPSAYRAGGAGETIHHATRDTALGPLTMAATARGVCFVRFGDSAEALMAELAAEYPNAVLQPAPASAALDAWIDALDAHLSQGQPVPDLPLDLKGTAFQLKVWRFLMRIKPGQPISYTELADGIGAPKAVRAAASACARNGIAVLVPCHRVLRGDGTLGGYRWGLERKRALLDGEKRA